MLKRMLDIAGSAAGLIAALPVMMLIAAAIRLTMGPPVFFRQQRPGLHAKPFWLIKFRTMRAACRGEERQPYDTVRITRLGRFLRTTSLDELPALWNVLRGRMSLVGPRPLLMEYLERYTPTQARRHEVRPGITGWAQVNGRNAITWEEKFRLDVWYVDNWSLGLDFKILCTTAVKVLCREGIGFGSEATMPEFMGTRTQTKTEQTGKDENA